MKLLLPAANFSQESVKTRHPQLLYESKLYKILQGGGGWSGVSLLIISPASLSRC